MKKKEKFHPFFKVLIVVEILLLIIIAILVFKIISGKNAPYYYDSQWGVSEVSYMQ